MKRRLPVGAEILEERVHLRIWAPGHSTMEVEVLGDQKQGNCAKGLRHPLESEPSGYFSGTVPGLADGGRYVLFVDGKGPFPDPASRYQPEGPEGPSQVVDPKRYRWSDDSWQGIPSSRQVLYEMHIGTFTEEGNYAGAQRHLPELAALGITTLELMPLADFPGEFGWGYDGVNLFAPCRLYGTPDDLRNFVNRAHELGMGVILDVVYNHLGPSGNYLKEFSADYFTGRYENEWGDAIQFDGESAKGSREFFVSNALYWLDEYHFDGLRFDATQQIFDSSEEHILAEIQRRMRAAANGRNIYFVAENECQHTKLVRSTESGGYGLDSLWNDDFHHTARVALTGHSSAYYSDHRGRSQELLSAVKWGYLFQGQWYTWQKKPRGTPALDLPPRVFVNFLENHDQVANSDSGYRYSQLGAPGVYRALTAVLLLAPPAPMLFQGQEFGSPAPFLYFADHRGELADQVFEGRKVFLSQFPGIAGQPVRTNRLRPDDPETFRMCKLRRGSAEEMSPFLDLHRDLIALRKSESAIARAAAADERSGFDGAVLTEHAFLLRFFDFANPDEERLFVVNLGPDLLLSPLPEPLLAPPGSRTWSVLWSSEDPKYGGSGSYEWEAENGLAIPGSAALLLRPIRDNSKE